MKSLAIVPFLLGAIGALAQGAPSRKALIIGNGSYAPLPQLAQSARNAETVASALRDIHFDVTFKLDLDQTKMVESIREFETTIQSGDIVFIYYSGYALQGEAGNWLLPIGFDPKNARVISRNAYLLSRLLEELASKPGPRLVVIDAATDVPELKPVAIGEGLANTIVGEQTLLCYSTRPGVGAKPQPGPGPGPFVKSLAAALKTPGLEPLQIFERVKNEVRTETKGAQSPLFVPFSVASFYFVEPLPAPPKLPAAPPPAPSLKAGTKRENPKDGLDYVWIPAGVFKMGCVAADRYCQDDEKPQHEVKITKPFWITRTEITVSAYGRFTNANGLQMPKPTLTNPKWRYTEHPISKVNWAEAEAYCKWAGGSLPSEAQWEYAARGGVNDQIYPWGNTYDPKLANTLNTKGHDKTKFPETLPVKTFLDNPNKFDLFDVAGNVREWTRDTYNPRAYQRPSGVADPVELGDGKEKVARGGSFDGGMKDVRLSGRDHLDPVKEASNQTGFRCVLPDLK
jgi:formylglycine-generating enzyme